MHILICHSCYLMQRSFQRKLGTCFLDPTSSTAASLTDTYNYAEHNNPDCVMIADAIADCPEFELLASLFKIMGTACVIIKTQYERQRTHPAVAQFTSVVEDVSDIDLLNAIKASVANIRGKNSPTHQPTETTIERYDPKKILLIGASTGGVDALCQVIRHFSAQCPPTLIVQHTGGSFASSLIRLLNGATEASVEKALDGAQLQAGHIYLAPGDEKHLTLSTRGAPHVTLLNSDLITGHRPSIDALFNSAVGYAKHTTAALLTGMGRDGAQGLVALRRAGALTIGQDEATSVVYGMPRIAMEMGGVTRQFPVQKIGPALLHACKAKARA